MTRRTMRGVWLEDGVVRLRDDLPVPEPPPGEARVRVTVAGICNTDLELIGGYYPFTGVLGHEFVGVVEEVTGERNAALVGRRVVGEINAACGGCGHCREGRPTHCARRSVLGIVGRDGAFAEHLALPVENLHPVPDDLPDESAVFAEPLAAALQIGRQVEVGPEDRVIVVGDGKLGQLIARSLALTGCRLLVVGRHAGKLGLLEAAGIRTARSEGTGEGKEGVEGADAPRGDADREGALPPGVEPGSFDLAVECTGGPSGFATARAALRPRGTLVLKSTYAGDLALDVSSVVVDEITLVGSRCGPFPPALRLLAEGRIDPGPLVDARYPLVRAEEGLERARRPGTLKVLLDMREPEAS